MTHQIHHPHAIVPLSLTADEYRETLDAHRTVLNQAKRDLAKEQKRIKPNANLVQMYTRTIERSGALVTKLMEQFKHTPSHVAERVAP